MTGMHMTYKKALVTGGAGFIGSHLADALVAQGVDVLVVDDLSTGSRANVPKGARFARQSILAPAFARTVSRFAPEVVFHLAAHASVPESVEDPAFDAQANVIGTIRVAQAALGAGARRLVFSSTGGALYGGEPPSAEDATTEPPSPYGIAKLAAEHYLRFFSAQRGLPCVSLRYANVYGPRQASGGEGAVVPAFLSRLTQGEPVSLHGSGAQTRDFVYVGDVVEANLRAAQASAVGAFNVGTGRETSVRDLLHAMERVTGKAADVRPAPVRAADILRSALRPDKAAAELGWRAHTSLEEGLRATADAYGA